MRWLERLKNSKIPEMHATKATKGSFEGVGGTFVAFVAPYPGTLENFHVSKVPANQPLGKMGDFGLREDPVPPELEGVAFGEAGSIFSGIQKVSEPLPDPDRYCWPNSSAMNTIEIGRFTERTSLFAKKGVNPDDADKLADALVTRDRECDDRRLCLECQHLTGYGAWRCGNWQAAGVAIRARDNQLPADLVMKLQHCDGFTPTMGGNR